MPRWRSSPFSASSLLSVSYSRNRDYIDAGRRRRRQAAAGAADGRARRRSSRCCRVSTRCAPSSDSANRFADGAPWSMRWGLFQGASIGNAARDAYTRELDGALLPQVAARIKERLIDYAPEPEKLYEYLKAYLMLGDPAHLDKAQLGYIARSRVEEPSTRPIRKRAPHCRSTSRACSTTRMRCAPSTSIESLVAQARSTIRQASIGGLIYRQVRLGYASDTARALRLDMAAGVGRRARAQAQERAAAVRAGHEPLHRAGLQGNHRPRHRRHREAVRGRSVGLGRGWCSARRARTSPPEFNRHLREGLHRVLGRHRQGHRARADGHPRAAPRKRWRSWPAPTSPLRGLLKTVDEHTFLVKPPDPAQPNAGHHGTHRRHLQSREGSDRRQPVAPGTQVTAHFAEIHRLSPARRVPRRSTASCSKLQQIQQKLEPIGAGVGQTDPLDPATIECRRRVGESLEARGRVAAADRRHRS